MPTEYRSSGGPTDSKPLSFSIDRIGNKKILPWRFLLSALPDQPFNPQKVQKKRNKTSANFHFSGFYVLVYVLLSNHLWLWFPLFVKLIQHRPGYPLYPVIKNRNFLQGIWDANWKRVNYYLNCDFFYILSSHGMRKKQCRTHNNGETCQDINFLVMKWKLLLIKTTLPDFEVFTLKIQKEVI